MGRVRTDVFRKHAMRIVLSLTDQKTLRGSVFRAKTTRFFASQRSGWRCPALGCVQTARGGRFVWEHRGGFSTDRLCQVMKVSR